MKMFKNVCKLIGIIGLLAYKTYAGQFMVTWDPNPEPDLASYKVYFYTTPTNVNVVPTTSTSNVIDVINGPVYTVYVTAVDTNSLESDPSNLIRYQRFNSVVNRTNLVTLLGATNWVGVTLIQPPVNGILIGTPPNISYKPTNYLNQSKDTIAYKLTEVLNGSSVTNYYCFIFAYPNTPPVIKGITVN